MAEENKKPETEKKIEEKKPAQPEESADKKSVVEKKPEAKPEEAKKEVKKPEAKKPEKPKKTEAVVNVDNLPISKKHSMAISSFIRKKKISDAISDLEEVLKLRKPVPMKGEIPHRKGKGMAAGRYPKKASEAFIKLLKSLSANANNLGIEEPVVAEAVANFGSRPYGRFGYVRKKRTHVKLVAKSKMEKKK